MKQKNILQKWTCLYVLGVLFSFQACSEKEPDLGILPPNLETYSVLDVTRTSVKVNGKISGELSLISECGVMYSTSREFPADKTTKVKLEEVPSHSSLELDITGLSPNEQYYYCWYATTNATEVRSNTGEFTTASTSKPLFTNLVVDSIAENFAKFSCTITEIGDNSLLEYGVSYKQKSDKTYIPIASETIDMSTMRYTVEVRDLKAQTTYMVRPYAKNSADETGDSGVMEGYGEVIEITTLNQLSPLVSTYDVTTVGITSITVSGIVTDAIGSNGVIIESGFCWSENENPSIADKIYKSSNKELDKAYSYTITGLLPSTTYYVCAYAKNNVDGEERIGYGNVRMVTTHELIVPNVEMTKLERGTASLIASATISNYDEDALIEKGFLWSKIDSEISYEDAVKNGTILKVKEGGKVFKATITGLDMNVRYHVRAYAIYEGSGVQELGYSWSWWEETKGLSFYNLEREHISVGSTKVSTGIRYVEDLAGWEVIEKGFCWTVYEDNYYREPSLNAGEHVSYISVPDGTIEYFSAILTGLGFDMEYHIRAYLKVKRGEEVMIMYSDTNWMNSQGIDISGRGQEITANSITQTVRINNLSEIPADYVIEEVGFFWEEWKENEQRTPYSQLPDSNKKVGKLDNNGECTVAITGLKQGVKYWVSFYIKGNGKIREYGWWEPSTAGVPNINDNHSPEIK